MKRKPKKPSVSKLKKKLDAIFSLWIRKRDRNICFTCGRFAGQNGHYVSRSHNSLRYSEVNCHAQCVSCNIFKRGNMDEYALALQRKYGQDILVRLNAEKNKIKQFTVQELQMLIKEYE